MGAALSQTAKRGFTTIPTNSPDYGDVAVARNADANALDAALGDTSYSAAGAILQKEGIVAITGSSALAMTLALPTAGLPSAGGDDGRELTILSTTAHAHTVTTPSNGIYDGTSTTKDTYTFAAQKGGSITLVAQGGIWIMTSSVAGALSEV